MSEGENYLSVSEAAARLGAKPRDISDLFYRRIANEAVCPLVCQRRAIPESYLTILQGILKKHGKLLRKPAEVASGK
jgi:hypothetical protein